jgi:hypothetical protein
VILTGLEIGRVLRAWPFSPKFKLGASGLSVFCVDLRPPFHTDDLLLGLPDDSYPQGTACMYKQHNISHSYMHTRGGIMHFPRFCFPVEYCSALLRTEHTATSKSPSVLMVHQTQIVYAYPTTLKRTQHTLEPPAYFTPTTLYRLNVCNLERSVSVHRHTSMCVHCTYFPVSEITWQNQWCEMLGLPMDLLRVDEVRHVLSPLTSSAYVNLGFQSCLLS